MKPEYQKVPIYKFDKTLAEKTAHEMNKLARISYADPWPRVMIPGNQVLKSIIVAKDGSLSGYAACVYFLTQNDNGVFTSRLFRAANKFHIGTPPVNESFGHYLAVRLLQEVLEAV